MEKKLSANGYQGSSIGIERKDHDDMNADVGVVNDPLTIAIDKFF